MIDLEAVFDKFGEEFLKFDRIENKLHARPDMCVFLLLDKLLPNPGRDMVSAATHDQIFLDAEIGKLAAVATEEDILCFVRCGVMLDSETGSLSMYA